MQELLQVQQQPLLQEEPPQLQELEEYAQVQLQLQDHQPHSNAIQAMLSFIVSLMPLVNAVGLALHTALALHMHQSMRQHQPLLLQQALVQQVALQLDNYAQLKLQLQDQLPHSNAIQAMFPFIVSLVTQVAKLNAIGLANQEALVTNHTRHQPKMNK